VAKNSNLPFGSIAAEQSDAHAGNGRTHALVSQHETGKIYCFHRSPLCPVAKPARAVDSTRTQPFVPNSPDVVQLGRSMTKVSATWNIHEAGPFSES
jgi:hypothetical protein